MGTCFYLPTGVNPMIRTALRARRFSAQPGGPMATQLQRPSSTEMVMPAFLPGTAPIRNASADSLSAGDFRGDSVDDGFQIEQERDDYQ